MVAAVEDPRTAGSASSAIRRLGDSAVPLLEEALARDDRPRRALLVHAAATAAKEHGVGVVAPALDDPDRTIVLAALDALDAAGGGDVLPADVLARVFQDAAEHAARASAARSSLAEQHGPLGRALDDELDLARQLVITAPALRHGERVRAAVRVVDHADGQRRALGIEALDVLLSRDEAEIALPLVRRDRAPGARAAEAARRTPEEWLEDITNDPGHVWRSSWLAACARHAARG